MQNVFLVANFSKTKKFVAGEVVEMVADIAVNYVAVVVAAVVAFLIGWAWHSPLLFGKMWMELSGMTEKKMKSMPKDAMMKSMVGGFITTLISAYVLAHFVGYTQATTAVAGAMTGFWAWLGFTATVQMGGVLWEGKPFKLFLIGAGHTLVGMLVMGAILASWA